MPDVSRSPQWHAVRPWSPRFLLTVREITSVSTTFVLSSTCAQDGVDAGLASLGIASSLGSDDEDTLEDLLEASRLGMSKLSLVSDALGRGLSVNVNGAPWKRVLMRMDEKPSECGAGGEEEAILVIYGLMPGRQYDVEIGISFADGSGEEVLHSRMVTQAQPGQSVEDDAADTSVDSASSSFSGVSNAPSITSSTITPINTQRPITLDEYASQLRTQLSHLNQERDTLSTQLKAARKEAHKADGAKRNEIDTLKRAAEKYAAAEVRGRQKTKALAEAAKQAAAAAREAEESARELEDSLPALRAREIEVAAQHASVVAEATRARQEADEALAADRARTDALRNELNVLKARLEKLQAKKTRLSGETLPKIEKQLEGLVREVELVVRDVGAFEVVDNGPVAFDLGVWTGSGTNVGGQQYVSGRTPSGSLSSMSTTPLSSPPAPTNRQAIQGSSKPPQMNSIAVNNGSNLSSRAPPFDPSSTISARLGFGFPLQPIGPSARRALPLTTQAQFLPAHSQSQSVDGAGSGGANVVGMGTTMGPTRQGSLPTRMPP